MAVQMPDLSRHSAIDWRMILIAIGRTPTSWPMTVRLEIVGALQAIAAAIERRLDARAVQRAAQAKSVGCAGGHAFVRSGDYEALDHVQEHRPVLELLDAQSPLDFLLRHGLFPRHAVPSATQDTDRAVVVEHKVQHGVA